MYLVKPLRSFLQDKVIREHVANACDLLRHVQQAHRQHLRYYDYHRLCCRCWAEFDGLQIAGEESVLFALDAIDRDAEVGRVLALVLADCQGDRAGASEEAVSLLCHGSRELRGAGWSGLRLASSRHVEGHLRTLLAKAEWDFTSAAALDILAFHRLPVQAEIGKLQDEEGDDIAWLLAEAGGRLRGAWTATHLRQFLGHGSPRVREAALRASARCGLPELPAFCREATVNSAPLEAIEFLGVVGSPEDLSRLRRAAQSSVDPATAKAALNGLARLGLPASVPFLLDLMAAAELTEAAASAFWRITGQDVPRGPAPELPPGLTEDELDLWEPQPPVDVLRARDWWGANAAGFDRAKRYQVGLCVSDDPLGPVFDRFPLAIRYDVYLRERALTPHTPDWELETWTWRQKHPAAGLSSR